MYGEDKYLSKHYERGTCEHEMAKEVLALKTAGCLLF